MGCNGELKTTAQHVFSLWVKKINELLKLLEFEMTQLDSRKATQSWCALLFFWFVFLKSYVTLLYYLKSKKVTCACSQWTRNYTKMCAAALPANGTTTIKCEAPDADERFSDERFSLHLLRFLALNILCH